MTKTWTLCSLKLLKVVLLLKARPLLLEHHMPLRNAIDKLDLQK